MPTVLDVPDQRLDSSMYMYVIYTYPLVRHVQYSGHAYIYVCLYSASLNCPISYYMHAPFVIRIPVIRIPVIRITCIYIRMPLLCFP